MSSARSGGRTVMGPPMMRVPFGNDLGAARHVRRALAAVSGELDDDTAWSIELVMSELVSNVVQHTDGGGQVSLWDIGDTGSLRLEVADSLATAPAVAAEIPLVGGRGLRIVDEIAQAWGVEANTQGKTVWVEFTSARRQRPSSASSPFYSRVDPALAVVTTSNGSRPAGCLVAFHTQCGSDPVRYAVWLAKSTETHEHALETEHFAVHFLAEHQGDLAARFGSASGRHVDKFDQVAWTPGPYGVPLLTDCVNRAAFRRVQTWDDGGEHTCFIGAALDEDAQMTAGPALHRSHLVDLQPPGA